MKVNLKKLRDSAKIPTRGTEYSAGYDLYADVGKSEVYAVDPHTTYKVGTGIAVAIPHGYFGAIFARSGIASKKGLRPANCVGVVDSDYRGELIVALHNDTDITQYFKDGDRIAQLVILPYEAVEFITVDDLDNTQRGAGGFGSTGLHDAIEPSDVDNTVLTGQLSFFDDQLVTGSYTYSAASYPDQQ